MISLVSPAFTVSLSSSSSIPRRIRAVFTLPYVLCSQRDAHSSQRVRNLHKTKHFKLDYILDFTRHPCYPFFVLDTRSILARWRLIILWPFFVNKCCIASSVVMSFGCFFFFGMGASYESR